MSKKMFIIKADDYGRNGASIEPWRRFFDSVLDFQFNLSIGVVGVELDKNLAVSRYLRAMHEEYDIEIWNHSHTHSDYTKNSSEMIVKDLQLSQDKINNLIGVTPKIFGAPFNFIDQNSAESVKNTNFFSGYYAFDGYVSKQDNIELKYFCPAEVGTNLHRPVRFDVYKDAMLRRGYPDFVVIQVHPYYWSKSCIYDFKKILADLQSNGYASSDASDRLDYVQSTNSMVEKGFKFGYSLGHNMAFEDTIGSKQDSLSARGDSKYYFRMLNSGSSRIYKFLRSIGFHCTPMISGVRRILDLGAGIGNWTIAAALLPNSEIVSLDREDFHLKLLANHIADDSNISIVYSDFLSWEVSSESYSGIICNNTLSYINPRLALDKISDVLCFGGSFLVGIQNRLYPINDAILAINRLDYDAAIIFLERLINNEGAASGFLIRPFIRYFSSGELAQLALESGLKLMLRGLDAPGEYGLIQNKPTFSTYLMLKTKAASAYMRDIDDFAGSNGVASFLELESKILDSLSNLNELNVLDFSMDELIQYFSDNFDFYQKSIDCSASFSFFFSCALLRFNANAKLSGAASTGDAVFDLIVKLYASLLNKDIGEIKSSQQALEEYLSLTGDERLSFWL